MSLVLVDKRVGSVEVAPYIQDSLVVALEYGDMCFNGYGPNGKVRVGVERKRVGDLVNSILSGRLVGHQLPGMCEEYDVVYLVVEGLWREGYEGGIEVFRGGRWCDWFTGRLKWSGVQAMLVSCEEFFGARIRKTTGIKETGALVSMLAKWWGKEWDKHTSHRANYRGRVAVNLGTGKVGFTEMVAGLLPGIGLKRVKAVVKRFGSVEKMCLAKEGDWVEVEGIGKVTAKLCVQALHGKDK